MVVQALLTLLLTQLDGEVGQAVSESGMIAAYILATLLCARAAKTAPSVLLRHAWIWIALAWTCSAIAETIAAYYVLVEHNPNPFPTVADAFYLLYYPLTAIGVLLLPISRRSRMTHINVVLEASIVVGVLLCFSWYFLIGPVYVAGADSPFELALTLAYPAADLLVLTALLVSALRGLDPNICPSISGSWLAYLVLSSPIASTPSWTSRTSTSPVTRSWIPSGWQERC